MLKLQLQLRLIQPMIGIFFVTGKRVGLLHSPRIQNAAFDAVGFASLYFHGLFLGSSISCPLKECVVPLLDIMTPML
jgi:hypothetical protein